jgi:hypothetical protein
VKIFSLALLLAFTVETSAQSLADVARRERARQQRVQPKNKGIYTNATAAGGTAKPGTVAPGATAASAPVPKPSGPANSQVHDEAYWREAFQKVRADIKRAEEKVQILEVKVNDLNTQLLRQSDIFNREGVLGPQITAAQKELDAAKEEVQQGRNKLATLELELQRSGGLPGWAR